MAGHSKWANIKHRKGRQDAKRSKAWSKCSRAIIVAARLGGPDPAANLALRYAVDEAKAENMPKDTIQKAIDKGAGGGEGSNYEEIRYEGYGPHGVAVMLDLLTDNRNRTAGEIRKLFDKHNGNLGATGCVAYLFEPKGEIYLPKAGIDEDHLMELALETGASDITAQDEHWYIVTESADVNEVAQALRKAGFVPESASRVMIPSNTITLGGEEAQRILTFMESLEDHDDVQKVHANFEIPDEVMAQL